MNDWPQPIHRQTWEGDEQSCSGAGVGGPEGESVDDLDDSGGETSGKGSGVHVVDGLRLLEKSACWVWESKGLLRPRWS